MKSKTITTIFVLIFFTLVEPSTKTLLAQGSTPQDNFSDVEWLRARITEVSAVNKSIMLKPAGRELDAALKVLEELNKSQTKITGSVTLAMQSDNTINRDSYTFNGGFSIRKGSFPSQLSADSKISVKSNSEGFKEELSSLRVTYDRYLDLFGVLREENNKLEKFNEWVPLYEAFVFGDRFTDEFMSIDQRYEVGIGGKLEWNFADFIKGVRRNTLRFQTGGRFGHRLDSRTAIDNVFGFSIDTGHSTLSSATRSQVTANNTAMQDWIQEFARIHDANFRNNRCGQSASVTCAARVRNYINGVSNYINTDANTRNGLFRETSRFEAGVSVGILAEFEQASVNVRFTDPDNPDGPDEVIARSIVIDDVRTTRLSVRPSFRWRFNDKIDVTGRFFWKPAIDEVKFSGVNDLREELNFGISYNLDKVILSITYDKYYDRQPPTPTCNQLRGLEGAPMTLAMDCSNSDMFFAVERAEFEHEVVKMNVTLPIE